MQRFSFEVLQSGRSITVLRSVRLPDLNTVWDKVAELAEGIEAPGSQIRVTDESGQTLILVGVSPSQDLAA